MAQSSSRKILVLRFSSFGDVVQSLSIPGRLAADLGAEVHFVTRADLAPLANHHPAIAKLWTLQKDSGVKGVWTLAKQLRAEHFTDIYDAHASLRSRVLCFLLRFPWPHASLIRKSQKRWKRFLLFRLRINKFRQPFSGQRDLLEPLQAWGLPETLPPPPQIFCAQDGWPAIQKTLADLKIQKFITIAPSAAHALKRWPIGHWEELLKTITTKHPDLSVAILGGPDDKFTEILVQIQPQKIFNFAGKTNYAESAALIQLSQVLITNDTGALHVAEQMGHPAIALMGPAPFGFPSRPSTKIMQLDLACRPCSKHGQGPCVNEKFQRCMVDITPSQVYENLRQRMQ